MNVIVDTHKGTQKEDVDGDMQQNFEGMLLFIFNYISRLAMYPCFTSSLRLKRYFPMYRKF